MADLSGSPAGSGPRFQLLFQDDHLLVLDKPPGLLSVPGKGPDKQGCLSSRVQSVYPEARVVHRLDMSTSGLLVMARNADAQAQLNHSFSSRMVDKTYQAIVSGDCRAGSDQWRTIDLPVLVDWPNRPKRKIDPVLGKPCLTRWRCLSHDAVHFCSRLELQPVTGRSHQLRVHLLALGHPIWGDALYAPPDVAAASPRLMLHACTLAFPHPVTGERFAFASVCPF